jgi:hypothetical protein
LIDGLSGGTVGIPSENCLAKPEVLTFTNLEQLAFYFKSLTESARKQNLPVTFHGKIDVSTGEGYLNALIF